MNAPLADATGHAVLFNSGDYSSLGQTGKSLAHAKEAALVMGKLDTFLAAYSTRISQSQMFKIASELEVRLVMHVHQKRCDTRKNYKSFLEIAEVAYNECKTIEPTHPTWTLLAPRSAVDKHAGQPSDAVPPFVSCAKTV